MASPAKPSSSFQRSLARFRDTLSPEQRQEFKICTLEDVHVAIESIQRVHGRQRRLRNMNRVKGFLEAMEQYGKVIEVFLNSTEILGFVWVCRE